MTNEIAPIGFDPEPPPAEFTSSDPVTLRDELALHRLDPGQMLRSDIERAFRADGRSAEVLKLTLIGGGRSAVTAAAAVALPGVGHQELIVRAQVRGGTGIAVGSIGNQFALLNRLQAERLGAPVPILFASAGQVTEFYDLLILRRIPGEVPDPWRADGRERIAALRRNDRFKGDFVDCLARIHDVAPSSLPPPLNHEGPDSASAHPERVIGRVLAAARVGVGYSADPVISYVAGLLRASRPTSPHAAGLVHGDYRMGNMVVDDDRLTGVLDWELAEAGEVLSDVAWLCGPQARVDGFAGGLFGPEELVERYSAVSGKALDPDLIGYHTLEGAFRTTGVWLQLSSQALSPSAEPGSVRALLSVLQMKELLGGMLWPEAKGAKADGGSASAPPASILIERGRESLERAISGLTDGGRGIAGAQDEALTLRTISSFRRRLEAFNVSPDFTDYAVRVRQLDQRAATSPGRPGASPSEPSPGAILSELVTAAFEETGPSVHSDEDPHSAEMRALVRASAEPTIAFGDLLWSIGAEEGRW